MVVGFLGAGKTTFLRELLPQLEARGVAPFTIINDFQNARVDASSLQTQNREVVPITGNCICCDGMEALVTTLLSVPPAPQRVVLVEANGASDPISLLEHLIVKPELQERFQPLLQIGLIDARRWVE